MESAFAIEASAVPRALRDENIPPLWESLVPKEDSECRTRTSQAERKVSRMLLRAPVVLYSLLQRESSRNTAKGTTARVAERARSFDKIYGVTRDNCSDHCEMFPVAPCSDATHAHLVPSPSTWHRFDGKLRTSNIVLRRLNLAFRKRRLRFRHHA